MAGKVITQEERYEQMMHEPVQTLIPRMAVPSIISMLVGAIYNMADTFFVSQIGTSASAAVGVIFSLMALMQAAAFMIGMGSGSIMARLLGQKKGDQASAYVAVCVVTELLLGTLIAAAGELNPRALVYLLGATDTIAPYAVEYVRFILIGAPFLMCSYGMNNLLRFQGNAMNAMIGMSTGGILNMFLDPLLIYGFHMGIAGAAVATSFSQFVSFLILLYQCNSSPACVSVSLRNFRPTPAMYKEILRCGLPSLARQGIAGVSAIVVNYSAHPYGDAAIAAISIVMRLAMFMNSAIIGFGQGFQPVCSFNFGAGNYKRVAEAYYFSRKVAFCVLACIGLLAVIFAEPVITVFRRGDPDVIRIGTLALRLQGATLCLSAQIILANMLTQCIGYGITATLVASLKQGICLIPILLVLPRLFGLFGIQAAQPLSDIVSALIACLITRHILKELDRKASEQAQARAGEAFQG